MSATKKAKPNPYEVLRVRRKERLEAIKQVHHRRSYETHPDRGGDRLMAPLLAWHRDKLALTLSGLEQALKVNERASEMVKDHTFKFEQASTGWMVFSATAS